MENHVSICAENEWEGNVPSKAISCTEVFHSFSETEESSVSEQCVHISISHASRRTL